jgi:DNA-directed RNA polymerase specialized sigma24 family protein
VTVLTHPTSATGLLLAWRAGDEAALDQLVPLVHDELHRIARRCMHGERAGHSLQATALVNEAYLRLLDVREVNWQNRAHFLAMSARLMRRILVDFARAKRNQKRGGAAVRVTFVEDLAVSNEPRILARAASTRSHTRGPNSLCHRAVVRGQRLRGRKVPQIEASVPLGGVTTYVEPRSVVNVQPIAYLTCAFLLA